MKTFYPGSLSALPCAALFFLTTPAFFASGRPATGQAGNQPSGQSSCSLTLARSPSVRGVRLGMTTEQVLALFPGSEEKPDVQRALAGTAAHPNYGVAGFSLQPWTFPSPAKETFAGINSYSLTFFDGRLTEMDVRYNSSGDNPRGPYWMSVDDFIAKLSEAFNLPPAKEWLREDRDSAALKCADFDIRVWGSGGGRVRVFNQGYRQKVREREAADAERLRREFKP